MILTQKTLFELKLIKLNLMSFNELSVYAPMQRGTLGMEADNNGTVCIPMNVEGDRWYFLLMACWIHHGRCWFIRYGKDSWAKPRL